MNEIKPLPASGSMPESVYNAGTLGPAGKPSSTYGQIFKSAMLIGGSSVIDIAFRIIRVKVMAVLLGPAGIGLFGLFNSIADLSRTVAGMGVNLSGVRQIAEASGSADPRRIAVTVTTLRRAALLFGCLGALLLAIFAKPVAQLTFGSEHYADGVLLLSVTVLFTTVAESQRALLQGLRRIGDLARLSVVGTLTGTLFSLPLIYFFRDQGIVFSLVCVSGMGVLTSWWFARRVKVEPVAMTFSQVYTEAGALLKLGVVLMLCALLPIAVGYIVRIMVQTNLGIEAAGYYQAAWALSVLYVNFIIQAMNMDFYPRLTAASGNDPKCNRMMNEQAEVGLLLAGPGVMATLTFAPLVIHFFYSAKFGPTVELLRWNCLGLLLQVASWPVSTLQLAKGKGVLYFWTQLAGSVVSILLIWIAIKLWGLKGTAIASVSVIVIYCLINYGVARKLSGFRWAIINLQLGALFLVLTTGVFFSWYALPFYAATAVGATVTLVAGVYSLRLLADLIPVERMPRYMQTMTRFFRHEAPKPKV